MIQTKIGGNMFIYKKDGVWRCPLCSDDKVPIAATKEKLVFDCINNKHRFRFTGPQISQNEIMVVRMAKNITDPGVLDQKIRLFIQRVLGVVKN